jgi:hypothetical protein
MARKTTEFAHRVLTIISSGVLALNSNNWRDDASKKNLEKAN